MPEASANLSRFKNLRVIFRKTTLVDYPGKVAAALFLPGCGLRCPWCQNRELVLPGKEPEEIFTPLDDALAHIGKRRAVLGGVVISGGEPTGEPALGLLIAELHSRGMRVKLDTNGMRPEILRELFKRSLTLPDYVALDLKAAPERYRELLPSGIAARFDPARALRESAELIASSGIPREYRSLALPDDYFTAADVEALAPLVHGERAPWYFRRFIPGNCLDPAWNAREPPATGRAEVLAAAARKLGKNGLALPA